MKNKILQNGIFLALAIMLAAVAAQAQTIDPTFETAKLTASDGAAGYRFSQSVSISGDTAIIGAFGAENDNGYQSGAAYIFARDESGWNEQTKLTPPDGAAESNFGESVSISGDTAIVGAPRDADNGHHSGSAYIFVRVAGVWTHQAKLTASDGGAGDFFGLCVSISRDAVIIGAPYADNDNGENSGSAYIFTRDSTRIWTQQAKTAATDGATAVHFGASVSVSEDTAVVGTISDIGSGSEPGWAYIFERNMGGTDNWGQVKKLTASDGVTGNYFGRSVSISGNTAIVGASGDDENGNDSGSAYIFVRDTGVWTEQAKLLASDGWRQDWFGISVSISGDTLIVGSGTYKDYAQFGAAYIFVRNTTGWTEVAKLIASDGAYGDFYAGSVSISEDTAIVGADSDDDIGGQDSGYWATNSGSAYVFELSSYLLIADIEDLVEQGALASNHGRALTNKLNLAIKQLEKGNTSAAVGKLNAVIEQTQDFIADGHISTEDGQAIIDAVQSIIDSISG